ncbi:MAG: nucleotidyltransferase domain-containing protein [Oscillospiraceae bacterium]|nr:nucleotidyltransferase domain-containing protein [Oscillospiraceae bacterium]
MIDAQKWTALFLERLDAAFGARVRFAGLQGSYARGEATEDSDIDLVVILDELSPADIRAYGGLLDAMPDRRRACGFLSGWDELLHWEPSELFQFCRDTRPLRGSLGAVLALVDGEAVDRAVRIGVCGIYHGCVHNMLYEKSDEALRGLYKSAAFALQAVCFRQTGRYIARQAELPAALDAAQRPVAETCLALRRGAPVEFDAMSEALFLWAKAQLDGQ